MALALIYTFARAKPFSIRRLAALCAVTLILTTPALEILRVRNAQSNALVIAASLTLLVWSIPLFRSLRDSICRRSLTLDALRSVSGFVQLTYAFGFASLLTVAGSVTLSGAKTLTLGHLAGLGPTTFVMALIIRIALPFWPPRGRSRTHARGSSRFRPLPKGLPREAFRQAGFSISPRPIPGISGSVRDKTRRDTPYWPAPMEIECECDDPDE